jgi:hypothetical protein
MGQTDLEWVCRSRRRTLLLGAALALTVAALAAWSPARAEACTVDYCTSVKTNASGTYVLNIPANTLGLFYSQLDGCVWEVEAQFSDGSPSEQYAFDEAEGLIASHTFPEPGVYTVLVLARNGIRAGTEEPCPDLDIEATVTYPEPTSEPPPEEPPPDPDPPGGDPPPAAAPPPAGQPSVAADGLASEESSPYWRHCAAGARAHLVGCRLARRLLRRASATLGRRSSNAQTKVAGFRCRLRAQAPRLICVRGQRRVVGPRP